MPNDTAKKRRVLPWALAACALILCAAAVFALSVPVDLTRYADRIEAALEERVNGDVELGGVVVKALPSPEITLTGVTASHRAMPIFSADRLLARIKLLPLLSGRLSFEAIEADNPHLVLVRGRDGALNASDFFKKAQPAEDAKKGRRPKIDSLKVDGGRLLFIDRFQMQTASFYVTGIKASVHGSRAFTVNGRLAPSARVDLTGSLLDNSVEGKADIKDFPLSAFTPYIKSKDARISASVDAALSFRLTDVAVTTGDVTYRRLRASYPTTWDAPLVSPSGSGKMTLTLGKGIFDLTVDDVVVNMDGYEARGMVHVEGPKDHKTLRITAESTPVEISKFLSVLPMRKVPPLAAERVRAIEPLGGTATVTGLVLAGATKEFKGQGILTNPQVQAGLSLKDVSLRYKGVPEPFTDISGVISYKDKTLGFAGVSGRHGRQRLERLDGTVRDITGAGAYNTSIKGSMDLRDALEMARGMVSAEARERLAALEADGTASVDARFSGAWKGKAVPRYSGTALLSNGSAFYKGVPLGLDSIDASFAFDNRQITLNEARARTDSSAFSIKGFIDGYRGPDPSFSVSSNGSLTAETLSKVVSKGPGEINLTSAVPFTLSAEGRKKDFAAKASLDATDTGVFIKKYVDKAPGFPMRIEAEGALKDKTATVKKGVVSFGGSVITGSGTKTLGEPVYGASIVSEQIRIADLDGISPYLSNGHSASGSLSFAVKTSKESATATPAYEGKARIKDGSFETGLLTNPVTNVNATAEFSGNKATIVVDRVETGSTSAEGRLDVHDIAERSLTFDVRFPALHAADLVPVRAVDEKKADDGEDAAPAKDRKPVKGSGKIRADEGDLWGHKFSALSADVLLFPEGIGFSPVTLGIDGGRVAGSAFIFLDENDDRLFTAEALGQAIRIEQVIGVHSPKQYLNGSTHLKVQLTGIKGDGPLMKRIYGSGNFVVMQGRFWKFGFITDVFSIVNIISLEDLLKTGLPYKDITGTFDVKRGVISTSDIAFDSRSLRMSAVGALNVPEKSIDLTLAIHPFVTIDKIITNIPLVGWIVTGREKSTVSFYFEIEGPAANPSVTPLPVKTIEKSVLGILERLLKYPFELFK